MDFHDIERLYPGWEVVRLIGEGAFGSVYEIRRDVFGRGQCAALKVIHIPQNQGEVKQLRTEGMDENSVRDYFYGFVEALSDEIGLLSKLTGHTNVVSYQDHQILPDEGGQLGWTILIRMELLKPLKEYLLEEALQEGDVLQLGLDIARALNLCGRHRIIHRDIKPDNIFLSENGDYKLGDFGVARELEKTTMGMSRKGTLSYMAPEVFNGKPYNRTADIYSLGVVLYTLLNQNRTPFLPPAPQPITWNDRETAQIRCFSAEALPPIDGVSETLMSAVLKMCAKDPEQRFQSAAEVTVALEAAAAAMLDGTSVPYAAPPPTEPSFEETQGEKTVALWADQPAPPAPKPVEQEDSRWLDGTLFHPAVSDTATTMTLPGQPHRPEPKKKKWLVQVLIVAAAFLLAGIVVWLALRVRPEPPQPPATEPQQSYTVGDTVHFGQYDWRVLDVQNGKALLLSEDIVEQRAYNDEDTDITWETCTLRAYLNGEFYENFSEEDRARIALTRNENPDNTWGTFDGKRFNTPGGNPTNDYIFLLSVPEVLKYYPGQKPHKDSYGNEYYYEEDVRLVETISNYVDSDGYTYNYYEEDGRLVSRFSNYGSSWWLRSPGDGQNSAADVRTFGIVYLLGCFVHEVGDVRPALWVDLGGGIAAATEPATTVTTTTKPTTTTQKPTTTTTTTKPTTVTTTTKKPTTEDKILPTTLSGTYVNSSGMTITFYPNGNCTTDNLLAPNNGTYTVSGSTVRTVYGSNLANVSYSFIMSNGGNTLNYKNQPSPETEYHKQ